MNAQPGAPAGADPAGDTQRQINLLADQVRRLCLMDLAPVVFYREFLQRVVEAVSGLAASYWTRNETGGFQELSHISPSQTKVDVAVGPGRNEMIRLALEQARPAYFPPGNSEAEPVNGPLECALLVVPVAVEEQVQGLVEVWLAPGRNPQAIPGLTQFLVRMADLVGLYILRQRQGQQTDAGDKIFEQLEAFSQRIHGSLNPTEVAYLIANEGRQLSGTDRCTVALRQGRRAKIEAISGVDVVDQRSNLARRLRSLCDGVLQWGERLVYDGTSDASLPPNIIERLDAYLEESHCKVLIVSPLRDKRESAGRPSRAALIVECFQTAVPTEQLTGRLDVVGKHATTALYNASLYRGVPLRFLWRPVARIQEGLGGKTRAILAAVFTSLLLVVLALFFVPYPLKLEAEGELLPERRRWVYTPVEGQVIRFEEGVEPGRLVFEGQSLILLYDVQLENRLTQLTSEINGLQREISALGKQWNVANTERDRLRISADRRQKETIRDRKVQELRTLGERTNSDPSRPGHFWLRSPLTGTVLNWDFRETMTNRQVGPAEPLLRIGDKNSRWEIELRIPQKQMGHIVQAFPDDDPQAELDVDLLLISAPTRIYKGKLARDKLAGEARADTNPEGGEPAVLAFVRIEGPGIAKQDQIPRDLLITGTEVHTKVRCGNHAMGYSLFYGVWEFLYEKVVFFF